MVVRTCIGCRERAEATDLVRLVLAEGGVVRPDEFRTLPGRGAHLHPSPRCWEQAVRRRAFARALRTTGPLELGEVEALARTWQNSDRS